MPNLKNFNFAAIAALIFINSSFSAQAHDALMKHLPNAQAKDIASLNVDGVNTFLEDIVASNEPNAPIS